MNELKFTPETLDNGDLALRLVIPAGSADMLNFCMDDAPCDEFTIPDLDIVFSVDALAHMLAVARAKAVWIKNISIEAQVRCHALDETLHHGRICILNFPTWFSLQLNVYNPMSGIRYFMDLDPYFATSSIAELPSYLESLRVAHVKEVVHV